MGVDGNGGCDGACGLRWGGGTEGGEEGGRVCGFRGIGVCWVGLERRGDCAGWVFVRGEG